MVSRRAPLVALMVALGAGALVACQDPVHDQEVAALGGEAPGVSPGPTHRPGQPCTVCHGGQGPASLTFVMAGTVYAKENDTTNPAVNATVSLEDVTGSAWHATTNEAGNFFVLSDQWSPTWPVSVPPIVSGSTKSTAMVALDNRSGSCATCHTLQAGPDSNGPVYLSRK